MTTRSLIHGMATHVAGIIGCAAVFATALPPCVPNGTWLGSPCTWPSSPPAGCPLPASAIFTGVSFSGRFGAYPTTAADTWYPYPSSDGSLFTTFADGKVCTTQPTPPLPPTSFRSCGIGALMPRTTYSPLPRIHPRHRDTSSSESWGTASPSTARQIRTSCSYGHGRSDYFTTAGPADEADARAAGYTLIATLGATMPPVQPAPDPRPLPNTTSVHLPAGQAGWSLASLQYSAARNDHFTSPDPLPVGAWMLPHTHVLL